MTSLILIAVICFIPAIILLVLFIIVVLSKTKYRNGHNPLSNSIERRRQYHETNSRSKSR